MSDKTSISIIIPTRNRPLFLKEAVDSVLCQTHPATEIIIIDDNSEEEYKEEIKRITANNSIVTLHRFDVQKGVSHCRNFGIEQSIGEYILFLDDDDTLDPNMLEHSLEAIKNVDVVSCRTHVLFDEEVNPKKAKAYNWQEHAILDVYKMEDLHMEHIFLYHPMIHSFLFRKSVFDKIRFPEDLTYGEDFYVWLQLAHLGLRFKKLDFVGGNCRMHSSNTSSKTDAQQKLKFYSKILNELSLSDEVKNLTYLKMAVVLWKSSNLDFIKYLFRAISKPILVFRHVRHFIKVYY